MTYRVTFYDGPVSCPSCHAKLEKRKLLYILEAQVTPKRRIIRAVTDAILSGLEHGQTIEIERTAE